MQQDGKRCVIVRALLSIAKLYEGWTYTVEQGTYDEQLLMMSWLKYDKIMLAVSIPRAKRRKTLIIGVITTCGSTCTLIHMMPHGICRVCIIGPTVITWAYQFVGMLPASMCYTGGPCGTLKCALLAAIATSNCSANFILYVLLLNHAFGTMRGLDWHLCFDVHTRRSGGRWSS